MEYISYYKSPLGRMLLSADEVGLTGAWFIGQKYFAYKLDEGYEEKELPIFLDAKRWLDLYFSKKDPDFSIPLHLKGSPFQKEVWEILLSIPYGETLSYGEIADRLAKSRGIEKMSARAVGSAVGHNPISIIVPCHRVIGKNGSLTGYAGGLERKMKLLALENEEK